MCVCVGGCAASQAVRVRHVSTKIVFAMYACFPLLDVWLACVLQLCTGVCYGSQQPALLGKLWITFRCDSVVYSPAVFLLHTSFFSLSISLALSCMHGLCLSLSLSVVELIQYKMLWDENVIVPRALQKTATWRQNVNKNELSVVQSVQRQETLTQRQETLLSVLRFCSCNVQ